MRADYDFPKVTRADYPLLSQWLSQPHIDGWWGSPSEEIALIEEDIDEGPTDMRLVALNGHPFAFIQDYDLADYPGPHLTDQPPCTRAIDTFLGDTGYLGKGHAPAYLRQRALQLLKAGATGILIDPDPANTRAISAYRKAGFENGPVRDCGDGHRAQVMTFTASSL